jgi:hypothetical protein
MSLGFLDADLDWREMQVVGDIDQLQATKSATLSTWTRAVIAAWLASVSKGRRAKMRFTQPNDTLLRNPLIKLC